MTDWAYDQCSKRNVVAILHVGDLVDNMAEFPGAEICYNDFWQNDVPCMVALGNHDYGSGGSGGCSCPRSMSSWNSSDFVWTNQAIEWNDSSTTLGENYSWGAATQSGDSFWATFDVNLSGNIYPFLVFCLQFGPHDNHLTYMNDTINAHPEHNTIVITHQLTNTDNSTWGSNNFAAPDINGAPCTDDEPCFSITNFGAEIDRYLQYHDNIVMAVSGHTNDITYHKLGSIGQRKLTAFSRYDDTDFDDTIHCILQNYQAQDYVPNPNVCLRCHCVRMYEFHPADDEIVVFTYETNRTRYWTDPGNNFTLTYNFTLHPEDTSSSAFQSINDASNGSVITGKTRDFNWTKVDDAVSYRLQIASDQDFTSIWYDNIIISANYTEKGRYIEYTHTDQVPYGWRYYRIKARIYS